MRFILRPGLLFSDGSLLDAHAVAFTLGGAARAHTDYSFLSDSSVRVVDDTTLDIMPVRVNGRLVEQRVHPTYDVVSPRRDPPRHSGRTGACGPGEDTGDSHTTGGRTEEGAGDVAERAAMYNLTNRMAMATNMIPNEEYHALAR